MSWLFGARPSRYYEHAERMEKVRRDNPESRVRWSWPHPNPDAEAWAKGRRAAELEHSDDLVSFGLYLTGGAMTRGDVQRELGKWREQQ